MELLASYGTRENILIEKKRCFDFDKCDFNATKVHHLFEVSLTSLMQYSYKK